MKFTVELLAFGKPGETREVDCKSVNSHPPEHIADAIRFPNIAELVCQEVFRYGQNELQPQDHPSVSAGDVIHLGEDRWLIMAIGFHKMTPEDYEMFKSFDPATRLKITFETQRNYELISKYAKEIGRKR